MAKKKPTKPAEPPAGQAKHREYSADERRAYVVAVIAKQCGVSQADAEKKAAALSQEKRDALHDAGREGRVADCREILGL